MGKIVSIDGNTEDQSSKHDDVHLSFQKLFRTFNHPEQVEQEWREGELEDEIFEVLGTSLKDLEKLYQLCQSYKEIRDSMNPYLALSIIHLKLVDRQPDKNIEPYLDSFMEDPVETIDLLMKATNLLVLFGHASLAVKLSRHVFERVAQATNLWLSPERGLAKIIFYDELQKMFIRFQEEGTVDWSYFDALVRPYGYDLKESDYKIMEQALLGEIDSIAMTKQFKKNFSPALFSIRESFCVYMWAQKKMPFATSQALSNLVLKFLVNKQKGTSCGVDKFFSFQKSQLERAVVESMQALLPDFEEGMALLWGLPVLYTYLNLIGLIKEEILAVAVENADSLKNQIELQLPWLKEKYNFIEFIE